jgi:hypothetical protein
VTHIVSLLKRQDSTGFRPADPTGWPQDYGDWAAQQQVFESMAALAGGTFTLPERGAEPEDLRASRVTRGFFQVPRVRPAIGQPITADMKSTAAIASRC